VNGRTDESATLIRSTIIRTTVAVGAITAGVLVFTIVAAFVNLSTELRYLMAPSALLGILSPIIGYRLYLSFHGNLPPEAALEQRCRRFFMATLIPLAVTEGIALFGLVSFMLCGEFACLIGVATHVILAAAIWPTPERLEQFLA
jgi:hypothetical protein